jgi:dCTP deaminase
MSFLSDGDIRAELVEGGLVIEPLADNALQPASVDVRLSDEWMVMARPGAVIKGKTVPSDYSAWHNIEHVLTPGEFLLVSTMERVEVPPHLLIQVNGKSSWARKGLVIHLTAGFIDPGFKGNITLELVNLGPRPILLRAGDPIAQLAIARLSSPAERPYGSPGLGSHYQHQLGVQGAR